MKLIKVVLILSILVLIFTKALKDNKKENENKFRKEEDDSEKKSEEKEVKVVKEIPLSNTYPDSQSVVSKERKKNKEEETTDKSSESEKDSSKKSTTSTSKERKTKKEEETVDKSSESDNKSPTSQSKSSKERKTKKEEETTDKSSESDNKSPTSQSKSSKERKTKKEEETVDKSSESDKDSSKKSTTSTSKERKTKKEEETTDKSDIKSKTTNSQMNNQMNKENKIKLKFERVNLKRKQELLNNIPGKTTTFDMGVEAEIIEDPSKIQIQQQPENPPKHLKEQEDIPSLEDINPAENASLEVTGVGKMGPPPKELKLEPVSYVKELSPAGKMQLELQESGDIEYQKLLNSGFETPKVISTLIDNKATKVVRAANVEYNWNPIDPRNKNLWSNVEFNKYGNRLLDTHRYSTPAKFEKNMFGNVIVHAPSDSRLQITTPSTTTLSGFLSVEEGENLVNEEDFMNSLVYDDQ